MNIQGIVLRGKGLARAFGCPTANILLPATLRTPPVSPGVYAAWAAWGNLVRQQALVCVHEPLPSPIGQKIETHILQQNVQLYGVLLRVDLLEKRRDLVPYISHAQMQQEIQMDLAWVETYFDYR